MPSILNEINWLDIVFVILFVGMVYKGTRTGVGGQILSLVGWFFLLFVSIKYYKITSEAIFGFLLQNWARPASFFAIAAVIYVIIKLLERVVSVVSGDELAGLEKICGACIAGFRAMMFCGIIGILLLLIPVDYVRTSAEVESKTCMFFVKADIGIYNWMTRVAGISEEDEEEGDVLGEVLANKKGK